MECWPILVHDSTTVPSFLVSLTSTLTPAVRVHRASILSPLTAVSSVHRCCSVDIASPAAGLVRVCRSPSRCWRIRSLANVTSHEHSCPTAVYLIACLTQPSLTCYNATQTFAPYIYKRIVRPIVLDISRTHSPLIILA